MSGGKIPVSVLVLIHTADLQVLLLERAAHAGYWQSVTGSRERGEHLRDTAVREVREETGIETSPDSLHDWQLTNRYEIFAEWRDRYAAGVRYNTEHVFALQVERVLPVRLAPAEHRAYCWLPWRTAALRCFSWSNRDAIVMLPQRIRSSSPRRL